MRKLALIFGLSLLIILPLSSMVSCGDDDDGHGGASDNDDGSEFFCENILACDFDDALGIDDLDACEAYWDDLSDDEQTCVGNASDCDELSACLDMGGDDDADDDDDSAASKCYGVKRFAGLPDEDNDGDSYSEIDGDCNDIDDSINPDTAEVFDGADNNCDGIVDEGFDFDCDGYQSAQSGGNDCDDSDLLSHPGAPELPGDGIDQDCNGSDLDVSDDTGVFVATTGSDNNSGAMSEPLRTIAAAADLAYHENKSVFVAEGEYQEDVKTWVSLFGGYDSATWEKGKAATTLRAQNSAAVEVKDGDPVAIQGFTIIGGSDGDLVIGVYNRGDAVVVDNTIDAGSTTDADSISDGFYNDGKATLVGNAVSGGSSVVQSIGVINYQGELTLKNNSIEAGSGSLNMGVYSNNGVVRLTDNDISSAGDGEESHGVYNQGGIVMLTGNEVHGGLGSVQSIGVFNRSGAVNLISNDVYGGEPAGGEGNSYAVANLDAATLTNNILDGGSAGHQSVGLRNTETAILSNNVIFGGSASDDDGISCGILNDDGPLYLLNNIIDGGSATGDEATSLGVNVTDGTAALQSNNIWGANQDELLRSGVSVIEQITDINSCDWYGCDEASGNISEDPRFVDADQGDFHIRDDSPCLDAGTDPSLYIGPAIAAVDFDGDARPDNAAWDIGADEHSAQ